MSFTAADLDEAVDNLEPFSEDDEYGYEEYAGGGAWMELYYEGDRPLKTPFGEVKKVDSWGGEGDGAATYLVVECDGRLFQKTGYYSSWGESSMDGRLSEVEAFTKPVTRYRAV